MSAQRRAVVDVFTGEHVHLTADEILLQARQDLPEFAAGAMEKGDRMFVNTIVLYHLRGGKFARIRSARLLKKATIREH